MTLLLQELFDRLSSESEWDLLDLLEITSDQLVDKFKDEIEERYEELIRQFDEFDMQDIREDLE